MMGFFAKHKKAMIFGAVLALVFLVLTGFSMKNGGTEIKLTQFITREQPDNQTSTSTFTQTTTTPTTTAEPAPASASTYPDLAISFVEGVGFTPGSKSANVGQKIIITNTTLSDINVLELMPKTSALAQGVVIAPNASFEFYLVDTGLFTYRELNSQKTGRFFVGE